MSGYTPVFDTVFHGTLCGKWPTLPVWLTMLPMADKNGHIDMTPQAISALTGWPVDLLKQAIDELTKPDPESRSTDEDGRRLVLIDPENRSWGWRVVNHERYRERARLSAKSAREVASGANAARMHDRRSPPLTAADPLSNSNANTYSNKEGRVRGRLRRCPEGWMPNQGDATKILAEFPHVTLELIAAETLKFRDHEFRDAKLDFDAAWRNWMRRAFSSGKTQAPRKTKFQLTREALDRATRD